MLTVLEDKASMFIPLVGGVVLWLQDRAPQKFDWLMEQAACGTVDPSPACHVIEQAFGKCCISWTQRSHLSGPPSESESSTPLVFSRLSAGSGVGGGWWAKSVVTEKHCFHGKRKFGNAGGQPRATRQLETRKFCVHSVVACPEPSVERDYSIFAPNSAAWLPTRAAMS